MFRKIPQIPDTYNQYKIEDIFLHTEMPNVSAAQNGHLPGPKE
jgi:hypothetical protein